LLVEDNDLLRVLFSVILGDAGYEVLSVADGRSALSEMDCAVKAIDAVVTDIDLGCAPNGWIVALSARERWPACRVLYLTGVGTDARSLQGVSNGVFLSKPFDVSRVGDVLTALFAT
jgi:DNA-binding response OmpR family regulator